ncbi:hypothetical protein vseg_019539 [Gypsophila vaccaria]
MKLSNEEYYIDEVVPPSLVSIVPILRVADEIDGACPRLAYLCRLHAYEKAHGLDPNSSNCDVMQFKANLLQRLNRDKASSNVSHVEEQDARELCSFYLHYTQALNNGDDTAHLHTSAVLHHVISTFCVTNNLEQFLPEVNSASRDGEEKRNVGEAYNVLPLNVDGASHAIMQLHEVKAAVSALRNIDGLGWPPGVEQTDDLDLLDWLGAVFGFQRDNVRNQREHLTMLLANVHVRLNPEPKPLDKLDDRAVDAVINKLLQNYKTWCKFLGCHLRVPHSQQVVQHEKILYIGLYLLIWGEAANVRFMPECLCYIFHNMAHELCVFLSGEVRITTGEDNKRPHSVDDRSFLCKVIMPLYDIIEKEAQKGKGGKAPHSAWCNYDDLNEYFWSSDCFSFGWPMRSGGIFSESTHEIVKGRKVSQETSKNVRKSYFVESRTFWHIFQSFDRLWTFYVLALQVMVIFAWIGTPMLSIFRRDVLYAVSSIFITASFLRLLQRILDVIINFPFQRRWIFTDVLRSFLKIIVSLSWAVALSSFYARSFCMVSQQVQDVPAQYILTATLFSLPSIMATTLSLFPMLRQYLKHSDWLIIRFLIWWSQPKSYVGRGMRESHSSYIKYMLFWVLLLTSKFAFSFFVMIRPLVVSTKYMMTFSKVKHQGHEFSSHAQNNAGVLVSLWTPVIMVFFLDTQIWYSLYSTACGSLIGAFDHLGEIRSLKSLRSKFQSLPGAFVYRLVAKSPLPKTSFSSSIHFSKANKRKRVEAAVFSKLWNEIILCFREEDIVNDRKKDLLHAPYSSQPCLKIIQWPLFLLAGKILIVLDMAVHCRTTDSDLWKRICSDEYMKCAVIECYISFKRVLTSLVASEAEQSMILNILEEVERNISMNMLLTNFKMSSLPTLYKKIVELVEYLRYGNVCVRETVALLLRDMLEVARDMMVNKICGLAELGSNGEVGNQSFDSLVLPEVTPQWEEQIKRLYLLLTVKNETLINLEARRRIAFFANSLFVDMPCAPKVRQMLSFSVLTPYYNEEAVYSSFDIAVKNEDDISFLYYLQKIFPDEWNNFLERINCKKKANVWESKENILQLRHWVSLRGQTLYRTVRGMMYYRRALRLQAFLEMADEQEILEANKAVGTRIEEDNRSQRPRYAQIEAVADLKFTYLVTCQNYGYQKRNGDRRAADTLKLMVDNPSLRVAYIDEVEDRKGTGKEQKLYYSVLVKALNNLEQEIYRIKLPGPPKVGEGKPENQNHAIIFTRGEALQAIDMNQDNYFEEALKMRNLLEEFNEDHGVRPPTILGVREYVFTGSFSSLAWFMSNQETSFFSIQQRVLARPLKVRFHYGHPDVFDRIFHITRGGISKASCGINLSEDIFAGFNSTLRRGNVTHHEYIQVGKGRDIGLNQISTFEAKVACGNGEQTLSRDLYRLGNHFDFFCMLSCYFTTIGYHISSMLAVLTSYAFLYGRVYLVLSGLDQSMVTPAKVKGETSVNAAMTTMFVLQLGLLMVLPMFMKIGLEKGFGTSVMQLPLASIFFTFSLGTKIHYYGRTILHGGTKYRATGRGFVVHHEKFAENYRMYSRSHFMKGIELMMLLMIYHLYGSAASISAGYVSGPLWFLVLSWLFAPFIFNPSGFEWSKIVDDWHDWMKWICSHGGLDVPATKSWGSWWDEEHEHLLYTGFLGRFWEIVLSIRFFLIQHWLMYYLRASKGDATRMVYGLSWLVIGVVVIILKIESISRKKVCSHLHPEYKLLKLIIFIGSVVTVSLLFLFQSLTIGDIFVCLLAFMLTGWSLLSIAVVCKPLVVEMNMWSSIKALARGYEFIMGFIVFTPVAALAWFPFVSDFQTRLLFNKAFSAGLRTKCRFAAGKRQKQTPT